MTLIDRRELRAAFLVMMAMLAIGCGGGGGGGSESALQPPPASGGSTSNSPPTISGQPTSAVTPGSAYDFQPQASDPDGDKLTFTSVNLPSWARLNASTGRVTGTPNSSQVGTYSNIVIRVSDGTTTVALPAFSITVTDSAIGSALVSWTPPTQNTDGSSLTNLAGYEIRYGRSASNLDRSANAGAGVTSHLVENLTAGTWYFSVAARNSQGVTSVPSAPVSKTIS